MNLEQYFIMHPGILDDADKVRRLLLDNYSGDVSKVNRMMAAYDSGITRELIKESFSELDRNRIIYQLVDVYNMNNDKASDAIEEWCQLFSKNLIDSYFVFKSEKNSFEFNRYKSESNNNSIVIIGNEKTSKLDLLNSILKIELINHYEMADALPLIIIKKSDIDQVNLFFCNEDDWDELYCNAKDANSKMYLNYYKRLNSDSIKNTWLNHESVSIKIDNNDDLVSVLKSEVFSKTEMLCFTKIIMISVTNWSLNDDDEVVFTPELTDKYRIKLADEYIELADRILISMDAGSAMTGVSMKLIRSVFKDAPCHSDNIYIAVNQYDNQKRSGSDWKTKFNECVNYFSGRYAYSDPKLASANVLPVFPYLYSLLYEDKYYDENDIRYNDLKFIINKYGLDNISDNFDDLLQYTNIDKLRDMLSFKK